MGFPSFFDTKPSTKIAEEPQGLISLRSNKREPLISNPNIEELDEVLRFAFAHLPETEQPARIEAILLQLGLGTVPLDGIFQAKESDQLVGALFTQIRSDGTIVLWPPTAPDRKTERKFFAAFERYAVRQSAKIAVMLVDRQQNVDNKTLKELGGFAFQSEILYLVCETKKAVDIVRNPTLEFVPMTAAHGPEFERITKLVRETYRNSSDFPALVGFTPTEEVLRGYQRDSVFHPELWFFIRYGDTEVGVLLLADQPDDQMELIYMGLCEPYRGLGFAKEIVAKALDMAKRWNRPLLLTAVDEQNAAAIRAYLNQGFAAWDRKKVFARFF